MAMIIEDERDDNHVAHVALGANMVSAVGPPRDTLHAAIAALEGDGIRVLSVSQFYETQAWPNPSDPPFINAVCKIGTLLTPGNLLLRLQQLERKFGRVRSTRNAPRTLDLDIIDCAGRVEEGPPILPHPRVAERGFVLIPLRDVAPTWRHPVSGRSVDELIAALPPEDRVARPLNSL